MPLILAVDDESSGLYFRKLILEHAGHTVLSACTTEDALRLFTPSPWIWLLRITFWEEIRAIDMAREMKRIKPQVPIILLSGRRSIPEPLEHTDRFLSKTEGPEELLEVIADLLGGADKILLG